MLFLVKLVRTVNDNIASVFFNSVGVVAYFWVGFALCCFSFICSVILIQIHESVATSPEPTEND